MKQFKIFFTFLFILVCLSFNALATDFDPLNESDNIQWEEAGKDLVSEEVMVVDKNSPDAKRVGRHGIEVVESEEIKIIDSQDTIGDIIEEEVEITITKKTLGEIDNSNFVNNVTLQGLDKITAKIHNFDVQVGTKVDYERLTIEVMKCWKAPPTQTPENKVLLRIWEKKPVIQHMVRKNKNAQEYKLEEVFFGWMFSSSPGLSGLEHPVYDITVIDCIDLTQE